MTPPRGTPIARLPRASKRDILRTTFDGDTESEILADIRKALGREPDLVLWRLSQGGAMAREGGQTYRAGLSVNGAADLIGILSVDWDDNEVGMFFALEVKSARGKQSAAQVLWGNLVRKMGGFYAVVRSVEEARDALERARLGKSE